MNQMAEFCERVGADVQRRAARHRLRPAHRHAPSSSRARATAAPASPRTCRRSSTRRGSSGWSPDLLEAVEAVNDRQKRVLFAQAAARARGSIAGPDRRGVGPRLQGRDGRHAREPGHPADRGPAGGRGDGCRRTIPRRIETSARDLRRPRHAMPPTPTAPPHGADALRDHDRVAGVPEPGLRAAAPEPQPSPCSSTAATSSSRRASRRSASTTTRIGRKV